MGTALTGLEIRDTYDALIKIGGNGPLTTSAQFIGDGLGNDSVLTLSTTSVGIGGDTSGTVSGVAVNAKFCVKSEGSVSGAGFVYANDTTAANGSVVYACRSRGTIASPTAVVSGDRIASLIFAGNDGTDLALAAQINIEVDGTVGANDMPGRINFLTTPDGTQAPTEKMRIANDGKLKFNSYGSGTITGTPAYNLGVDASGNVIELPGGVIDGAGTASYVPKWTDANTLGNSQIFDNGTNVGIGTASPTSRLHISGASTIFQITDTNKNTNNSLHISAISQTAWGIGTDTSGTFTGTKVAITDAGNVGIGTSTPNRTTEIVGGSGATLGVSTSANGASLLYGRLAMYSTAGSNSFIDYGGEIRSYSGAGIDYSDLRFYTAAGAASTEKLRITSAGNVGIGTSSPSGKLHVYGGDSFLGLDWASANYDGTPRQFRIASNGNNSGYITQAAYNSSVAAATTFFRSYVNAASSGALVFESGAGDFTTNGGIPTSYAERMRITSAGNVGIGTTTVSDKLTIKGTVALRNDEVAAGYGTLNIVPAAAIGASANRIAALNTTDIAFETSSAERFRITNNGVTFNGDTAAANALDDYEEGTWTMGIAFGGAATGITYGLNTGTYTKIGRQVTVSGYMNLTSKGSSTGTAKITGLPFTIGAAVSNYATANMWYSNVSFANQFQAIGAINTTLVELYELTEAGAITSLNETNFADNSEIIISFTYNV
nr:MAG TPA: L-shaped tail fiber protein [Crassvirales sp.]